MPSWKGEPRCAGRWSGLAHAELSRSAFKVKRVTSNEGTKFVLRLRQ